MKALTSILMIGGCLLSFHLAAQGQREEARALLKKVSQHYLQTPSYEARLSINYFLDHTTEEPKETSEIVLYKKGRHCYKRFMHTEEILNDELHVSVDHQMETMTYGNTTRASLVEMLGVDFSFMLDSSETVTVKHAGDQAMLHFTFAEKPISSLEMTVNTRQLVIEQQVLFHATPYANVVYGSTAHPRIKTTLVNMDPTASIDEAYFSAERLKAIHGDALRNYIILNTNEDL